VRRIETLAALKVGAPNTKRASPPAPRSSSSASRWPQRLAPQSMPGCRADLTDAAAIAQLADDFLIRAACFGDVEFKALIQMGWSAAQLREHGDAARAVADRKALLSQTAAR
jgi:hypothetical protein